MNKSADAYERLAEYWAETRGHPLDLPALLELRARSRAFAFACRSDGAADRTIDLEDWAQLLYSDPDATHPGRRAAIEGVIEAILRDIRKLAVPQAAA